MGEDYQKSPQTDKIKRYQHVIEAFMSLMDEFNWWWIGFYFVSASSNPDILALGPFQGPLACTLIKKGKGVCGSSWAREESIIVPDVQKFEGHIACSSFSKSQIVIPLFHEKQVIGVLDLDSEKYSEYDEVDDKNLKIMLEHLGKLGVWKWVAEKF